jgi:cell division protein YceG involved in septum cleavage
MTSNDIADRLVSGQVISDRAAFLQSVVELGLSTSLKTGSFKLSSDMTIDEIIDIIS